MMKKVLLALCLLGVNNGLALRGAEEYDFEENMYNLNQNEVEENTQENTPAPKKKKSIKDRVEDEAKSVKDRVENFFHHSKKKDSDKDSNKNG